MKYVDGFVIKIKKSKVKDYKKMALEGAKIWMKYGALQYFECISDDLNPFMGTEKQTGFPKLTKMKKDETIWFSFIIYKNRKQRDSINKKMMKDMEKMMEKNKNMKMPFEMKDLSTGGFNVVVER